MSVTMAGLAPVGVKQTRVSRASRSAMPVKASLGSNFTAGGRVDFVASSSASAWRPAPARRAPGRHLHGREGRGYIKLAIEAGKANPPPIGPALGAKVRSRTDTTHRAHGETSDAVAAWRKCTTHATGGPDPRLGTRENTSDARRTRLIYAGATRARACAPPSSRVAERCAPTRRNPKPPNATSR